MKPRKLLIMLLILCVALVLRVYLLFTSMNSIEADQATAGLMAIHILQGERPLFYYGQSYQGPLEAYLTAPLIGVFGPNRVVIRVVPIMFSLAFVWVTYLLGKHFYTETVGLYSAIYVALSPSMLTFRSLMADADYIMVLVAGNISLVLFHSLCKRPTLTKYLGLAVSLALGFWFHPVMGYYLLTFGIAWLIGIFGMIKHIKYEKEGNVIACPLSLFSSFVGTTSGWYLKIITTLTLPIMLGFLVPLPSYQNDISAHAAFYGNLWITLSVILSGLIVLVVAGNGLRLIQQREALLPVFAFLTLYTFSTFSIFIKVKVDNLTLPRYLIPLYSAVPLGVYTLFHYTRRNVWLRPALMGTLLVINLHGNLILKPVSVPYGLLEWLTRRDGKQYIYTDYGTGYWLAFESKEQVIPAVIDDYNRLGNNRYPPYLRQVEESDNPLYVYQSGAQNEKEFKGYLVAGQISYRVTFVDGYAIYYDLSPRVTYPLTKQSTQPE